VSEVHFVVPDGIDDPERPSGGNVYDRRVSRGLAALGWTVHEHAVPGDWPRPGAAARAALDAAVAAVPDGSLMLIDGLIASTAPDELVPAAVRRRLVILVHMPLGVGRPDNFGPDAAVRERAMLSAAAAVVTTSKWTRDRLIDAYGLPGERISVAEPGVDPARVATATGPGGRLLTVAAVTRHKGHDVLLSALAKIADRPWHWTCVGSIAREPAYVDDVRRQARADGVDDRVHFTGAVPPAGVDAAYAQADVLVVASHAETYGMVVPEALARGVPVVATAAGGLPDALGTARDGTRPGLLVPPNDPGALAEALSDWFADASLRRRLRRAARDRRATLSGWSETSERIATALTEAAA
jgi:glycosyltransferase involved in cell wall biosynthesis